MWTGLGKSYALVVLVVVLESVELFNGVKSNLHVAEVSCRSFMPTFHEGSACRRQMLAMRHLLFAPLYGYMLRDVSNL